jgi:ABC-2 type transport system permease protein
MVRQLRLYVRLILLQLRTTMEYRGDFWIAIVGALLQQAVGIVFLITFFGQVPALGEWTVWNVLLLHGMIMLAIGLTEMFAEGTWRIRIDVNQGTFDRILVRPLPPVLQQLSSSSSIHGLGDAGIGVAMLIVGLGGSQVAWHWWTVPVLIMATASGFVICASINLITNLPVFWEPSAQSAFPTMVARMRDFAKFPLTIYPGPLQLAVMAIPYAFVSYFPILFVLERGGPERWLGLATPLVAAATTLAAIGFWRVALNRYQGVGH